MKKKITHALLLLAVATLGSCRVYFRNTDAHYHHHHYQYRPTYHHKDGHYY